MYTAETIIETVCTALKLDKDKLNEVKNLAYMDGRHIAIYLIRQKVKVPFPIKKDPEATRTPTYKEIAYIFKRKQHGTIMYCELECKKLIKVDKPFREKYEMVVNLLDGKTNIA